MRILGVALVSLLCITTPAYSSKKPLSPTRYQKTIGQGFTTNYFKTLNFAKYNKQNIEDVYAKGFRNLRLRCRADLEGLNMTTFLNNLATVVDDCLVVGISPIISWIHHEAESYASSDDLTNYLIWWNEVATTLKDKDYRLSFNLFTELGVGGCGTTCEESLRENTAKYNDWTSSVVDVIRNSGGNNDKRIIILGSPKKTASGLDQIDQAIYANDKYMLAEWHIYASGPNKRFKNNGSPSQKYWNGTGEWVGKSNVDAAIKEATDFTANSGLKTYLGAWMPQDNANGDLTQPEVINFAKYFVQHMGPIPWSLNVLDRYYNTTTRQWNTGVQTIEGQALNMSVVLEEIINVM